jgi:LmbE family N-acetylglucosaminyl deacetylase
MCETTSRLLVVSPHLDDGVFSCGALLATHPDAAVATVFAAIPPRGFVTGWDARCGFTSSADSQCARLAEDDAALASIDAIPIRLPFFDSQYERPASREAIAAALERIIVEYDVAAIAIPLGLFHSDHILTCDAGLAAMARLPERGWFVYEDALYRRIDGLAEQRFAQLREAGIDARAAEIAAPQGTDARNRDVLKRVAVHHYASQLRALRPLGQNDDVFAPERYWRLSR